MSGPSDPEKTPALPAWAEGLRRSLEESRVEPWEPEPVGHDEDGRPILSNRDWLKMAEWNREGWEPAPEWMERALGMRLTPDDASVALRGMVRGAEREADERAARVQGKGAAATRASNTKRRDLQRTAMRRVVDHGTSYACEVEKLDMRPHVEPRRIRDYGIKYGYFRSQGMSEEGAHRAADAINYG
jgi:hypothetical protein